MRGFTVPDRVADGVSGRDSRLLRPRRGRPCAVPSRTGPRASGKRPGEGVDDGGRPPFGRSPVPFRPVVQPEVLRAVDRCALRPWQGLRRRSVQEGARTAVFRLLGALNDYAEPADEKQVWDVYAGNARVQR